MTKGQFENMVRAAIAEAAKRVAEDGGAAESASSRRRLRSGPPSPEEFQRQLAELMRQHFRQGNAGAATKPDFDGDGG